MSQLPRVAPGGHQIGRIREQVPPGASQQLATRVFPDPRTLGEALAGEILRGIDAKARERAPYFLGCPGSRSLETNAWTSSSSWHVALRRLRWRDDHAARVRRRVAPPPCTATAEAPSLRVDGRGVSVLPAGY